MNNNKRKFEFELNENQLPATVNINDGTVSLLTPDELMVDDATRLIAIEYENYFTVNVEVLMKLTQLKTISNAERGYITEMAAMLKTEYNALFNKNNTPHNIESLSNVLNMHYDRMSSMLKKLVKIGILGKLKTRDKDYHVMNPFFARRRKFVDKELKKIFTDFSEL